MIEFNDYGYSRTIYFKIYDVEYRILWFVNQCTLRIGMTNRACCLPFNYIYFDNTYPLVDSNKSIGFSYVKLNKESFLDRSYPFEVLRIPIELNN